MGIAFRSFLCVGLVGLPGMTTADTAIVSADAICADRQMSYKDRTDALRAAGWNEGADDATRLKTFRSANAMRFVPQLGAFMAQSDFDAMMALPVELPDPIADKDSYSYWQRDGGTLAIRTAQLSETIESLSCQYVGRTAGGTVRPLLTTSPLADGLKLDDTGWPTSDVVDIVALQSSATDTMRQAGFWNPMGLLAYEFVASNLPPYDYPLDYNVLYEVHLVRETLSAS